MRSIGRAARQARRARKLTQEDVAERVGVSTQFYGRIERGYALPSVTTLRRMLEVLDLRADELLGALDLDDVGPDEGSNAEDADQDADRDADEDADLQLAQDLENPRLRRVMRYLRRASTATLHVVEVLLDQMDQAGALRRAQGNADPGEPHREPEDDDGEPDDDEDDLPDDDDPSDSAGG